MCTQFNLEKEPVFVVVVSTTGDGDAPDTANKFWRRLKKRTLPADHLKNCKYALLGECVCSLSLSLSLSLSPSLFLLSPFT